MIGKLGNLAFWALLLFFGWKAYAVISAGWQ
jgi:hypothetical protein